MGKKKKRVRKHGEEKNMYTESKNWFKKKNCLREAFNSGTACRSDFASARTAARTISQWERHQSGAFSGMLLS